MVARDFKGDNISVTGAAAMDRVLRQLPKAAAKKSLSNAVLAGSAIVRKAAQANLGTAGKTGDIVTANVRRDKEHSVSRDIGVRKTRFYLNFLETGTAPHLIRVGKSGGKGVLADSETGDVFGAVVSHPGQPARPFLRPAFDGRHSDALDAMGKRLGDNIEKATAKAAGKFSTSGYAGKKGRR